MPSTIDREDSVKASIPRQLNMAILKIQVGNNLDWDEACVKASELLDSNSEEYKRAVQREAQRLYKSEFMRQLNAARKTFENQAWQRGTDYVRKQEDNFRVPCSVCRKPMYMSSRDANWGEKKEALYKAFSTWHHTTCG